MPYERMMCRELGDNLISFQFNSKRDLDRVISMEPWQFNKHTLVLKSLSGDIQPSTQKFDKNPFWIRLYDIRVKGREENSMRQIGMRLGEVREIDFSTTSGIARSIQMKVMVDLTKPLKRGIRIRIGSAEPCWIPVTYERFSSFCYWCGRLGHTIKDCEQYPETNEGTTELQGGNLPYGEWMKASPLKITQVIREKGEEE